MRAAMRAFVFISAFLEFLVSLPAGADGTLDEYRRAVALVTQLQDKYANDQVSFQAEITDRTESFVLCHGAALCRNFNSPHCPPPTRQHSFKVLDPYPDDVDVVVLKGTYYYFSRTTMKNALGGDVLVYVFGTPSDLRKAKDQVSSLARSLREKGIDPETGESLERLKALKQEEARQAAEAKKAAELENAKKADAWAGERDRIRSQSTESKGMAFFFLVEEFPQGCLLDVTAPPGKDFQVLVRNDLPPELFGYCNYQKRVPIEQPVAFCRYLKEKGHKRGAGSMFTARNISTYPCLDGKTCLFSVESDSSGAFPCPQAAKPTPVPNPFTSSSSATHTVATADSNGQREAPAAPGTQAKNSALLANIRREIEAETKALNAVRSSLAEETRIHERNLLDMRQSGSDPKGEVAWFEERKAILDRQAKPHEEKLAELQSKVSAITGEPVSASVGTDDASRGTKADPKNDAQVTSLQRDIDRETDSLKRTKNQLADETRIHEQNLRDMQKSGSNPTSTIAYYNDMKAQLEKRIKDLEDKIRLLESQKGSLQGPK